MDNSDERDYEEEQYNRNLCPECDYSPCHCSDFSDQDDPGEIRYFEQYSTKQQH
jgi:hypothetical protein